MRHEAVEYEYTDSPERLTLVINQLADAIHDIAGLRPQQIALDGGATKIVTRESRYTEIAESLAGQQGSDNGSLARSMPPIWIDALAWLAEVDSSVRDWIPDHGNASTPDRLYALLEIRWRPQETRALTKYTEDIVKWVTAADLLLEDQHRWELAAPCPACGTKTVHRKDTAGDYIRQAALQVTAHGCTCQACKYTWAPEYYQHLARVIGCDMPTGVLE